MENHVTRRVVGNRFAPQTNERNVMMNENVNPIYPTYFDLGNEANLSNSANMMPPAKQQYSYGGDVEIVDLDDPRRDVKPTTWHRN